MIFEHNLQKFHQNLKNFYQIKFYDAFIKLESEKFHNFINTDRTGPVALPIGAKPN